MRGETNLQQLLRTMKPALNEGEFIFYSLPDLSVININDIIFSFKEKEGFTVILEKSLADKLNIPYSFVAAWITLTVHSSLEAVGLTAAFSKALADEQISCNVVAGFYHDHIFLAKQDAEKAMEVLIGLSQLG
ncbi:MAG: ACT domain-containing protein [Chitinophagales bacterium]|nr:ACT domain-containing protein [Chitinophagales bacterium]